MLSIKLRNSFFTTGSACVLVLAISGTKGGGAAQLAAPVTWGSPDQPYGKRRPVTAADHATIQSYRSGRKTPIFSTNFTDADELQADWNPVSDDNQWGDYQSCRRPSNVEVSNVGLRLRTLVATDCHHKWSTGHIQSKASYGYGFFEATMKIADIKGMNNAFWMTTEDHLATGNHFKIDVSEVQYPSYDHIGLQQYPAKGNKSLKHTGMGWGAKFADDLSSGFHDYGVLWTATKMMSRSMESPWLPLSQTTPSTAPRTSLFRAAYLFRHTGPSRGSRHDCQICQSVHALAGPFE
jgi:Glycosyl hydrolases family 16